MSWFDKIKYYYDNGLWDKERICKVVGKAITVDEYEEIIGEVYNA